MTRPKLLIIDEIGYLQLNQLSTLQTKFSVNKVLPILLPCWQALSDCICLGDTTDGVGGVSKYNLQEVFTGIFDTTDGVGGVSRFCLSEAGFQDTF